MSIAYQMVVCGSIVPDPLQTLEPLSGATGPALKNEMMLPAVLDPWAGHALYEAANLARNAPGSKVWLVSLGPKAKLQQVMMTVAQKVPFELVSLDGEPVPPWKRIPSVEEYYRGKVSAAEIQRLRKECAIKGVSLHGVLMQRVGWPAIPFDGRLLVSHQDALLMGGKVQAPPGYADHVVFLYPELCEKCGTKICIELCSGQAITPGEGGVPSFDREKCVHCGACYWNCAQPVPGNPDKMNIAFRAGTGGLHSAEN